MSDYAFEQAVTDIIDHVRDRRLTGIKGSVWSAMVAGFREHGACDGRIVDVIEDAIETHLGGLRAAEIRVLWAGCESGYDDSDAASVSASELRRFLEPEPLARITEVAGEEARDHDLDRGPTRRSRRRAPKRARGG
ncbi:MAG: hypothetical protein FJ265_09210 [Planctomycetes bacterium]|nr:hypothetical protein [Planctomycetota bacterium]